MNIGDTINRLTLIEIDLKSKDKHKKWICKCECGKIISVRQNQLKQGIVYSCGCYAREKSKLRLLTHGQSRSDLYHVWISMKGRCYSKGNHAYENYGKRGITICEEWKNNFMSFFDWANNNGYKEKLTIERIDNDKDYCPDNCKWISINEQAKNKRNNVVFLVDGKLKYQAQICSELNMAHSTFSNRIKRGWDIEKIINTPPRKLNKESR